MLLLLSGGGDAAAAVVPRPCIWSGMMIRTGCLAWPAGLACDLELLGRQLDWRQAGTRHGTLAVRRLFTCRNCLTIVLCMRRIHQLY